MSDPYLHEPALRGQITDPEESSWRSFTTAKAVAQLQAIGMPTDWFFTDAEREARHRAALAQHPGGDLWVFAYGSLMWDPGFRFDQVRRAHVPAYARRFMLCDTKGGRGTADAPGLMAALDHTGTDGCGGLAFRIPATEVEKESQILFRREMIAPGYLPRFVTTRLNDATGQALTFVADHDDPTMQPDITRAEQIAYIATGAGFLGTSYDYLARLVAQFAHLDIVDNDMQALLAAVDATRA